MFFSLSGWSAALDLYVPSFPLTPGTQILIALMYLNISNVNRLPAVNGEMPTLLKGVAHP